MEESGERGSSGSSEMGRAAASMLSVRTVSAEVPGLKKAAGSADAGERYSRMFASGEGGPDNCESASA